MTTPTLHELVKGAMQQVSTRTKVASAKDGDRVALADAVQEHQTKVASAEAISHEAVIDDSVLAVKLAKALELVQHKVSSLTQEEPSLGVHEADHNVAAEPPKAPKLPIERATSSAPPTEGGMPGDSMDDHTGNTDWSSNKEAALAKIQEKVAKAELLSELGQHKAASEALLEARRLKLAADARTRIVHAVRKHASLTAQSLELDPNAGGSIPSTNQGMIDLRPSKLRAAHQSDAAKYISTNATQDPILQYVSNNTKTASRKKLAALKVAVLNRIGTTSAAVRNVRKPASGLTGRSSAAKARGGKPVSPYEAIRINGQLNSMKSIL